MAAAAALLAVLAGTWLRGAEAAKTGWRYVGIQEGVKLYERSVEGRDLPRVRGTLRIRASVFELLAVLDDIDRACEWNARCLESTVLERRSKTELVFYHLTDLPWPVSDRDVVLVTRVTGYVQGVDVTASFATTAHRRRPTQDGIVRIPRMQGHFRVQRLGPGLSEVTYELDADLGGWIPDWILRRLGRGVPAGTLAALQRYERRNRVRYAPFVAEHQPAPEADERPVPQR